MDHFGPLASMHAALDRIGLGQPCAATALLRACTIEEAAHAIAAVAQCFPVLRRRLIWDGPSPCLVETPLARPPIDTAQLPLFTFSSSPQGEIWRVRLAQIGADVKLDAVWAHAVADGLSMLAFLQAVAAHLRHVQPGSINAGIWPGVRRQPFAAWLPRFVFDQHRLHRDIAAPSATPAGASWIRIARSDSDRVLKHASKSKAGFAAWLAAAAVRCLRDQQGWRGGRALLNVPILRHRAPTTNGFGFGIGSLILSVPIERTDDFPDAATLISADLRRMMADGWNENFERLLSRDPRRHLAFARIQQRRPSPMITISWKGRHTIGDGIYNIACFAVSPAVHISAHADESGLSISLTSHQSVPERHAILIELAALLECSVTGSTQDLT